MTTTYHITDIRNVALAGHGASGKTSLADALLFAAGATSRKGSVDDGTSVLDVDEEEKRRHFTIDCHLGHLAWAGKQVHLIDTPGYPDFIGNALSALAAVENVVVAVSGPSGIEVNTRRLFQEAGRLGLGRFVVVTKMDAENVDYRSDLERDPRDRSAPQCVPFNVPIGQGPTFSGIVDVIQSHDEDPAECPMPPTEAYRMVVEQIVELDEDLMMRYLEGETVEPDELRKAAARRDRPGQARPGALRLHPQGPRRPRAARPDRRLRPEPRRRPPFRHAFGRGRRPRGGDPARRGRHAGRPGLQDGQRSVHGQAELSCAS